MGVECARRSKLMDIRQHLAVMAFIQGGRLRSARYANWLGCDLSGLDFGGCDLEGTIMDSCNLSRARFRRANLNMASLRYANMTFTDLVDADLTLADLTAAKFDQTLISSVSQFSDALYKGRELPLRHFTLEANRTANKKEPNQ